VNPLGHVVFACGVAWAGVTLLDRARVAQPALDAIHPDVASAGQPGDAPRRRLAGVVDYGFVGVGSLLPDLIDKPLGLIFFRDLFDANSHLYGHTLLLSLLLLLTGSFLFARRGDARLLCLGLGHVSHLLVDPVTHAPGTLLWPLLGAEFAHVTLLEPRETMITEAGAAAIMLLAGVLLWRAGRLRQFLRTGRL